jgi:hypothetical protein
MLRATPFLRLRLQRVVNVEDALAPFGFVVIPPTAGNAGEVFLPPQTRIRTQAHGFFFFHESQQRFVRQASDLEPPVQRLVGRMHDQFEGPFLRQKPDDRGVVVGVSCIEIQHQVTPLTRVCQLRNDVALFEAVKGRMLNASHMMLAYPSVLCGYRLVHEAMQDERLRGFLRRFLERDAIPLVEGPPGVSLSDYKEVILERFSNPAVGDQLLRIAQDGAAKIPVFHRNTIERLLETGGHLAREAFFLACFARYLQGHDDTGEAYDVVEPTFSAADWVELRSEDGLGLLRTSSFITLRLDHHAGFVSAYRTAASAIAQRGVGGALDEDHGHDW